MQNQNYWYRCGQMSRIDATKIAIQKAIQNKFDLSNAVVASDAFFRLKITLKKLQKRCLL